MSIQRSHDSTKRSPRLLSLDAIRVRWKSWPDGQPDVVELQGDSARFHVNRKQGAGEVPEGQNTAGSPLEQD
ncbi:hypothetical protein PG991_016217 [Apiospora marii]|uniref:Hypervirulence associated protein TUDOR domain-containing protein n=1 Tax=Apiospora marii TaxID=335849 RepID=A0ABR1R0X5_9PEZI